MQDQLIATAELAARAAGAEARRLLEAGVQPRDKGFRQWVTAGDVAAQEAAVAVIRGRYPDHAIVAEEGNGDASIPQGVTWFVDPVDGTTNYARQLPFFCVSVAAAIDLQPVVGVIYDPVRDQMFLGVRGQGATLDGQRIRAMSNKLADAIIAFDSPPDPEPRQRQWDIMQALSSRCRTVRELGSAALGMAYVAAGRVDAYLHMDVQPWDVAAGALLVEESGGVIWQTNGRAWRLGGRDVVLGNAALLDEIVAVVRDR